MADWSSTRAKLVREEGDGPYMLVDPFGRHSVPYSFGTIRCHMLVKTGQACHEGLVPLSPYGSDFRMVDHNAGTEGTAPCAEENSRGSVRTTGMCDLVVAGDDGTVAARTWASAGGRHMIILGKSPCGEVKRLRALSYPWVALRMGSLDEHMKTRCADRGRTWTEALARAAGRMPRLQWPLFRRMMAGSHKPDLSDHFWQ